jgi:hypothetical protein
LGNKQGELTMTMLKHIVALILCVAITSISLNLQAKSYNEYQKEGYVSCVVAAIENAHSLPEPEWKDNKYPSYYYYQYGFYYPHRLAPSTYGLLVLLSNDGLYIRVNNSSFNWWMSLSEADSAFAGKRCKEIQFN